MAAYDLVLAKMKSFGAAPEPAAKPSKKKRKRPETQAESTVLRSPSPATLQAADLPVPSSTTDKKQKRQKTTPGPSTGAQTSLQTVSQPKASIKTTVQKPAPAPASVKDPSAGQSQQARGRHTGRYHKVAAAKKAGSYSRSDLAAILGVDSFPSAAAVTAEPVQESSSDDQVNF